MRSQSRTISGNIADLKGQRVDKPSSIEMSSSSDEVLLFKNDNWHGGVLYLRCPRTVTDLGKKDEGGKFGFGNSILLTHPNEVPVDNPDVDRWFNTDVFNRNAAQQLASNYRQLPLRFSGIRSDGQFAIDMSFSKYFHFGETTRLQFRADSYNFTNTTSLNAPNTAPTNTAFGRVTSTQNDARNWQFALRLIF